MFVYVRLVVVAMSENVPVADVERHTSYPVTPTLSVDAFHDSLICPLPPVATSPDGAVGGVTSAVLLTVTLTAAEAPLLPAAS